MKLKNKVMLGALGLGLVASIPITTFTNKSISNLGNTSLQENDSLKKVNEQIEARNAAVASAYEAGYEYTGGNVYRSRTTNNVQQAIYNQIWADEGNGWSSYGNQLRTDTKTLNQTMSKLVIKEGSYIDYRTTHDKLIGNDREYYSWDFGEKTTSGYDIFSFTGDGNTSDNTSRNEAVWDFSNPEMNGFGGGNGGDPNSRKSLWTRFQMGIDATPNSIEVSRKTTYEKKKFYGEFHDFKLKYDAIVDVDKYDYSNDEINHDLTQQKIYNGGVDSVTNPDGIGEIEHVPYFTSENTYANVESYFINNKVIDSRDDIPFESTEIVFYDESGNEITNSNTNLSSDAVTFKLKAKTNTDLFIGETEKMTFEIPYFESDPINIDNILNAYDWQEEDTEDITDNEYKYSWKYDTEANVWTLNTNISPKFQFSTSDVQNITMFEVPQTQETISKVVTPNTGEMFQFDQYDLETKEGNFYKKEFLINKTNGRQYSFRFNFESFNKQDEITIDVAGDHYASNFDGTRAKDQLMVFDKNGDGKTTSDEVIYGSVVYDDFVLKSDIDNDVKLFQYNDEYNKFVVYSKNAFDVVRDKGIYGYRYIDEYNNVNFKVIEYAENGNFANSSFEAWALGNDLYNSLINPDYMTLLDEISYHEIQKIAEATYAENNAYDGDKLKANEIIFDTDALSQMTIYLPENVFTLEMMLYSYEEEIANQLYLEYDLAYNVDYHLEEMTPLSDYIYEGKTIAFRVVANEDSNKLVGSNTFTFNAVI